MFLDRALISDRRAGLPQAFLLLLGSCLPVLGAVLLAPVLPAIQAQFNEVPGSVALVPIVLTLPALMIAVLAPFAGVLTDKFGRKPLLLVCMLIYTVCGLLPLWLDSLYGIVASRAGLGLAEAGIMTVCTTLIGDYYSGARRQRLLALQTVFASSSAVVFIVVGGMLGQDSWRTPFVLYGVGFIFIPLILCLIWEPVPEQHSAATEHTAGHFPWRQISPLYVLALMAGASLMIVPVQAGYLLNLLGVSSPSQIGMTMGGNQVGVVVGAISFRLLTRFPAERLLAGAFIVAGGGLFLMMSAETHMQVVIGVAVNGLGVGLMIPTLLTWIMSLVEFDMRGRAMGGFTAAFFGGEFLSPLVVLVIGGGVTERLPFALGVLGSWHVVLGFACLLLPMVGAFKKHAATRILHDEA